MYQRSRMLLWIVLCLSVAVVSSLTAANLISYQGRLTNSDGSPVADSTYSIWFRIYNASSGGTTLWDNTPRQVPVTGGLFAYNLGDSVALPAELFADDAGLWLGTQVGDDPEIVPRTLLTSAPTAMRALGVKGDIETAPGTLTMKTLAGRSALLLESDAFGPVASRAGLTLFDPESEPSVKMFQVFAESGAGPSMHFFSHGQEVMGVEPSPFNTGMSWRFFDPQPEPPGKMIELLTEYGSARARSATGDQSLDGERLSKFIMYGSFVGSGELPVVSIVGDNEGGNIRIGPGADETITQPYIRSNSDINLSEIEIVGPSVFGLSPILLTAGSTGAKVGIGTNLPNEALHVVGNICYTGSIGACSDRKYKKDVTDIDDALAVVEQLHGIRYSWRTEDYPEMKFTGDRQVGFIAQDVEQVLPEAVSQHDDGSYAVDYSRITPLLVEAIKELKAENEQLKARLEKVEGVVSK